MSIVSNAIYVCCPSHESARWIPIAQKPISNIMTIWMNRNLNNLLSVCSWHRQQFHALACSYLLIWSSGMSFTSAMCIVVGGRNGEGILYNYKYFFDMPRGAGRVLISPSLYRSKRLTNAYTASSPFSLNSRFLVLDSPNLVSSGSPTISSFFNMVLSLVENPVICNRTPSTGSAKTRADLFRFTDPTKSCSFFSSSWLLIVFAISFTWGGDSADFCSSFLGYRDPQCF